MNKEKNNYYKYFLDCLENNKNFTYVRYNDGELDLISKKNPGFNQILERWGLSIEDHSEKLKNILSSKIEYYIGLCPGYIKNRTDLLESIIHRETKIIPTNIFEITDVNKLEILGEILKKRDTILVGPDYLNKLGFQKNHIETPIEYAWDKINILKIEIEKSIKEYKDPVILYSCSIATNILCDYIFEKFRDNVTQIDIGSSFDPFCGVFSRTNHDKIMKQNGIDIIRNLKKEIYQKKRT
jgi:hypothetical protein